MSSSDKTILRYGRLASFGSDSSFASANLAGDITVTATSGSLTFAGSSTQVGTFAAGNLIGVSGFTGDDVKFNGTYKVTGVASDQVTVEAPAGLVGATASATSGVTVSKLIRFDVRSEDFTGGLELTEDPTITGTRATSDLILQGFNAQGSVSASLRLRSLRDWFQAVGLEDWTRSGTAGSIAQTGANITSTGITGGTGLDVLEVGDWVRIMMSDTGNANHGKVARVSAVNSAASIDLDSVSLTAAATVNFTVVKGDYLQEDDKIYPHIFQREYADLGATGGYPRFESMVLNTMQLTGSSSGETSATLGFLGSRETSPTPSAAISSTSTGVIGGFPLSASRDVKVWIDGASSGCVSQFDVNIANNLDPRRCVGQEGATGMDALALQVSGSFTRYYATRTLYDKYLQQAAVRLGFVMNPVLTVENQGAVVLDLPRCKLDSAGRNPTGRNQQLFLNANFQALLNDAGTFGMRIWSWAN